MTKAQKDYIIMTYDAKLPRGELCAKRVIYMGVNRFLFFFTKYERNEIAKT